MSEYTPSTGEVREQYARGARGGYGGSAEAGAHRHVNEQNRFDRWLAAHDAEKRAEWEAEQGEPEWECATPRGFGITSFEFRDYDDGEPRTFTVQESSLASQRKVWIGVTPDRGHLSEAEATVVRDALNAFLAAAVPDTTNNESEDE